MDNCIFCKIVKGELPSVKIWEDDEFVAILDAFPNTKGTTLLICKEHYDSYVVDMDDDIYTRFLLATKKVSKLLEKGLNVKRVGIVIEGTGINHAHIKLYPMHGLTKKFGDSWENEPQFFETYPGYLMSKSGKQWNNDRLQEVANEILNGKIQEN
jgi:histidine triad (HIT) family protein